MILRANFQRYLSFALKYIQPTQTAFTFTQSIMERSEKCVKDFQHILQLALVFLYLHYKTKALFSFIKVECEFWNDHISKMGDFSLNPLMFLHKTVKFFTENCQLTFSAKFINNTFDKFNNIYYCFLLSGAAIKSHPGNNWIKNILLQINFTAFLKVFLEFCTYFTIFRRVQ